VSNDRVPRLLNLVLLDYEVPQRGRDERIKLMKIQVGATATDAGHGIRSGNSSKADKRLPLPGSQDMFCNVSRSFLVQLPTSVL
jgi:hypothetical protein